MGLSCVALGQVTKLILDPFEPDTNTVIILIQNGNLPQTETAFTQGSQIVGGERDLSLTANSGNNNEVLTSGVAGGTWNVATPNGATGTGILQYDGVDGSFNRNEQGLGNLDLTLDQANGFRFLISSDLPTDYTFRVYTSTGLGTAELSVPGGANFAQVGAIEIEVQLLPNVDSLISSFTTVGPAVATPSPNPSQAPAASRSPDAEIDWYTFDDDDNGRSPCGDEPDRKTYFLQDDNIIYYYFYGLPD